MPPFRAMPSSHSRGEIPLIKPLPPHEPSQGTIDLVAYFMHS